MSLFPEDMLKNKESSLTIESVAAKMSFFIEQFHLLHWQTSSIAEHQALGIYDGLLDYKDSVIERMMGYLNRRPKAFKIDPIVDYSAGVPLRITQEFCEFTVALKEYAEMNGMLDIANIADSMSGEANKLKYLLTLS